MNHAVIFTFEGVLIDSPRYNSIAFDEILKSHGLTMDRINQGFSWRGRSLRDLLKYVEQKFEVALDYNEFSRQATELTFSLMEKDGVTAPEGLAELLKDLKSKNIPVALATNSIHARVDRVFTMFDLGGYFPVVVTSEDVVQHKPHPDVLLESAKQLGVEPGNCVVIEDAQSGIDAAKRAGMKSILFTQYQSEKKETVVGVDLTVTGADAEITSFTDLSSEKIEAMFA
ncbi:MAG: HAD family phosphatase [Patescibacteria group bacterium]